MINYFYLYHFTNQEHTQIRIIPEQEFRFRLLYLRDLEGRIATEKPISLEGTNDCTIETSQIQEIEQKYKGKFTPFKRGLIKIKQTHIR